MSELMEEFANKFFDEPIEDGQVVSHEFFWKLFGLTKPVGMVDIKEAEKEQRKFVGMMCDFCDHMLTQYAIDVQNDWGRGYYKVPLLDRVDCAAADYNKEIKKALSRGRKRLVNIPSMQCLPDDQRKTRNHYLESIGAVSQLCAYAKKKKVYE